jgi:hypothetical protein
MFSARGYEMNPNLKDLARETGNPEVQPDEGLEKQVLVYATKDSIFAFDGKIHKPLLQNFDHEIKTVCFFKGDLYHGGDYGVVSMEKEKYFTRAADKVSSSEKMMCSLYRNNVVKLTPDKDHSLVTGNISTIHVIDDVLWFSDDEMSQSNLRYLVIEDPTQVSPGRVITTSIPPISAICGKEDEIYYAAGKSVLSVDSYKKLVTLDEEINALAFANDKLYAATKLELWDVKNNEHFGLAMDEVVDMCAMPESYIEKLKNESKS